MPNLARTITRASQHRKRQPPFVLAKNGAVSAHLTVGQTGVRLRLAGVTIWALPAPDYSAIPGNMSAGNGTTAFAADIYANFVTIAQTIKSWGGNIIRLRLDAHAYAAAQGTLTKAQALARIRIIRDICISQNMYLMLCWWDSHETEEYGNSNLPAHYTESLSMMQDVFVALGRDPYVLYEPWNEPDIGVPGSGTWDAWLTIMKATLDHWRTALGYTGVLVFDTMQGSTSWDETTITALESYDATLLGSAHQLVIAKHDYAVGSTNFDGVAWDNNYPDNGTHIIFETEFGYHVAGYTDQPSFSSQGAAFFAAHFSSRLGYAGAIAFLWGAWYDTNAITATDHVTAVVPWGTDVQTTFLGAAQATAPT